MSLNEDLMRLRKKIAELQSLGVMDENAIGTYQQTLLEILQEAEKRRQTCISQASTLRSQATAVEAQGHAFSIISSIVFSIVEGFVSAEKKRVSEEMEAIDSRSDD